MKLGHWLLAALMCIVVVLWGLYRRARASVQPVYDVLSIDERIASVKAETELQLDKLREAKFAKCSQITTIDFDKLDQIVKTCGSYLTLE